MESGTKLGHYEISTLLGKGGMGEVWRARDTKLGREVAIKTLPEEFAQDSDRLARFEREAKLLASLNHPNIAAIHGFEEDNGTHFLVLELVEGDTLADQIKRGAIPVEESLKIALQVAEALEAAHEKGVVHRDLKPANIKVTHDGKVKVLDFGLAKAFEGDAPDASVSNSPTLSMAATQQGMILGTAAYMSPEQASGLPADKRADVWSFGVVLFEMLTGREVFTGKTVSHILASVLNTEPDWSALPLNLHPRLHLLLERCLEKETADRYHDVADARVDIEKVLADPDGVLVQPIVDTPRGDRQSRLHWVAAVILGVLISGAAVWVLKPADPRPLSRWEHLLPDGRDFRNINRPVVAFSPEGNQFVYNGGGGLYLRSIDELEDRLIPGTEAGLTNPTFSPDGQWLAFFQDGQLKKIAVVGGAAVILADLSGNPGGISWDEDETILYASAEGIMSVSADGGEPESVAPSGIFPQLLADRNAVLFSTAQGAGAEVGIHLLDSGESTMLFPGSRPRYVDTGHIVYTQNDVLFALPFDAGRLEVTGGPVPLVEGLQILVAVNTLAGQYAVSNSGSLIYVPGAGAVATAPDGVLALVDRNGNTVPLAVGPAQYRSPRFAPDGRQLAVEIIDDSGQNNVWIYDMSGESQIRRLTQSGNNTRPVWSPDSERVTFGSDRDGAWGLYERRADGSTVAERLTTADEGLRHYPESWTPDGGTLAFVEEGGPLGWDMWTFSRENGTSEFFVGGANNQFGGSFSSDGRWLAYTDAAAPFGIRVQPFPPTEVIRQITQDNEAWPVWSADGDELFYRLSRAPGANLPVQLIGLEVPTNDGFTFRNPQTLPLEGALQFLNYRDYDIAPDGLQFVVIVSADATELTGTAEPPSPRVNVVENWFEELKERVPVP